jgi:hypothetical protein
MLSIHILDEKKCPVDHPYKLDDDKMYTLSVSTTSDKELYLICSYNYKILFSTVISPGKIIERNLDAFKGDFLLFQLYELIVYDSLCLSTDGKSNICNDNGKCTKNEIDLNRPMYDREKIIEEKRLSDITWINDEYYPSNTDGLCGGSGPIRDC